MGSATGLASAADVTLADGVATLVMAADGLRREALIVAAAANSAAVRIGDAEVGAGRGIVLAPGQPLVLATTAAIYGFADAAGQVLAVAATQD